MARAQATISYLLLLIIIVSIVSLSLLFARTTLKEGQDTKRIEQVTFQFHEINSLIQDAAREQSSKGGYSFILKSDEDIIVTTNKIEFIKRNTITNVESSFNDSISEIRTNSNRVTLTYANATTSNCFGIQLKNRLSLTKSSDNTLNFIRTSENTTTTPCSETIYQVIEVSS